MLSQNAPFGTPVDAADLPKGERSNYDHSCATTRANSGASSQNPSYSSVVSGGGSEGSAQHMQPKPDLVRESSVDREPIFRLGQRVAFYDKQGAKHYGVVRWMGRASRTRSLPYVAVGIQTVSYCAFKLTFLHNFCYAE